MNGAMTGIVGKTVLLMTMLVAVVAQVSALPVGVWIQDEGEGGCCGARLELAADGGAFCVENGEMVSVKVEDAGKDLRVEVGGETRWVLTRDGTGWRDQEKRHWSPREAKVKTNPAWTEVTLRFKDQDGPVSPELGVRYSIDSAEGRWDPMLVKPLLTKAGALVLKAPANCKIELTPEHPDFVRGANSPVTLLREHGAENLTASFRRGRVWSGKVVDEETGKPVAGARVCPLMFTPPSFSPDVARGVVTGVDGLFEIRGVDHSLSAEHPDFIGETVYPREEKRVEPLVVKLKRGVVVRGCVADSSGGPLAGVMVEDGSGKRSLTDPKGAFELRGLRKWNGDSWNLSFSKEGFDDFMFREALIPADGLKVALQSLPRLKGRVVSANGEPVRTFRVVCGPGVAPPDYRCESAEVEDAQGRFAILPDSLPKTGDLFWIGVRADGAAPWEGVVSRSELESGDHEIRLEPGVALRARIALPETAKGRITATLVPNDRKAEGSYESSPHPGVELASCQRQAPVGETLRFEHLRAGNYQLRVRCEGATPLLRPVTVGDKDVDLGELRIAGTGTIHGTLKDPYDRVKIWRFADGEVHVDGFEEPVLRFKTDAEGKFRVASVPAGKVEVVFPYWATADMVDAKSAEITVPEGGDVEVRIPEKPAPENDGGGALPDLPDLPPP